VVFNNYSEKDHSMDKSVSIKNLSFSFYRNGSKPNFFFNLRHRENKRKVEIRDINIDFSPNSYTLITGNNGSGKSSLVSVITFEGIFEKTLFNFSIFNDSYMKLIQGDVVFSDKSVNQELPIYQINNYAKCKSIVEDYVSVFRGIRKEKFTFYENDSNKTGYEFHKTKSYFNKEKLRKLYDHFNYENISSLNLDQMSDGQLNLTYLISTLLKNSFLYIFDEPLNALDNDKTKLFNDYLRLLIKNENKAVLVISHCFNNLTPDLNRVFSLNLQERYPNSLDIFKIEKIDNYQESIACYCVKKQTNTGS